MRRLSLDSHDDRLERLPLGAANGGEADRDEPVSDTFAFHPIYADSLNLPGQFNNDWNKAVELAWLRKIKGDYVGARTLHFGNDSTGTFISTDDRVSRVVLEGEYKITLQRTPGASQEVYAGIARFTIINGSQGWVISEWTDLSARGTYSTAGYLRGINRLTN